MRQALSLLDTLWYEATISGNKLGALILWNAMYHLEPSSGMIPSFDKHWATTKEVYFEQEGK